MGHTVGGAALSTPSISNQGSNLASVAAQIGGLIGNAASPSAPPQSDSTTQLLQHALQTALSGNNAGTYMNQQSLQQPSSGTATQVGNSGTSNDLLQAALVSLLRSQQPQPATTPSLLLQVPSSISTHGLQHSQGQAQLQQQLPQLLQLLANSGESGQLPIPQDSGGQIASLTGANLLNFVNSASATVNQNERSAQQPAEGGIPHSNTPTPAAAVAAGKLKAHLDHETQDLMTHIAPMPAELQEAKKSKPRGRSSTFPRNLFRMLTELEQQPGGAAIASFLPHGKS